MAATISHTSQKSTSAAQSVDPLRLDPSRTLGLRKSFMASLTTRFNIVKRRLVELIETEDAFGLGPKRPAFNVFCPTGKGGGVDPTCSPSIMYGYHGTQTETAKTIKTAGFRIPPKGARYYGEGVYFFIGSENSARHAKGYGDVVISARIRVNRPYIHEQHEPFESPGHMEYLASPKSRMRPEVDAEIALDPSLSKSQAVTKILQKKGYDSVITWEDGKKILVVFDPGIVDVVNQLYSSATVLLTSNQRWSFRTTPEQLEEFENWLREQYAGVILDEGNPDAWFEEYIRRGWQQGAGRAFQDARPRLADVEPQFYAGTREQFLRSAFNQPVSKERLKLLAGRTLTELRGVTQASATRMLRELTDGLVRGESPRDVARRLADVLDGDIKRAHTVARTETIRAHAEGQLDSLEMLGVSEVGAAVEWSTAHLRVCPLCRPLEGIVLTIQEARGMIPRHPNCRCAWIPANVGESDPKQIRTRRRIESQIRASVEQELPSGKRSAKEVDKRMRNTPWVGADAQISSERPKSILED